MAATNLVQQIRVSPVHGASEHSVEPAMEVPGLLRASSRRGSPRPRRGAPPAAPRGGDRAGGAAASFGCSLSAPVFGAVRAIGDGDGATGWDRGGRSCHRHRRGWSAYDRQRLAPGTVHQSGQPGAVQRHICSPLARASASSIAAGRDFSVMFAPVLGCETLAYPPLPCSMPPFAATAAPNRARARPAGCRIEAGCRSRD